MQLVLVDMSIPIYLPTTSHDLLNQSWVDLYTWSWRSSVVLEQSSVDLSTDIEAVGHVDQSGVDLYTLVLKIMKVSGRFYYWS